MTLTPPDPQLLESSIRVHEYQLNVIALMQRVENKKGTTDEKTVTVIHEAASAVELEYTKASDSFPSRLPPAHMYA